MILTYLRFSPLAAFLNLLDLGFYAFSVQRQAKIWSDHNALTLSFSLYIPQHKRDLRFAKRSRLKEKTEGSTNIHFLFDEIDSPIDSQHSLVAVLLHEHRPDKFVNRSRGGQGVEFLQFRGEQLGSSIGP